MKGSFKDHYYYGQHRTENLNDGYCGSGSLLRKYFDKYGSIENVTYTKEILQFYSTATELNQAEYELICDKYKTDELCINLVKGGYLPEKYDVKESTKQKLKEKRKSRKPNLGHHHSEETKQKMSESHKGLNTWRKGQKLSDETKQKMSKAHKGHAQTVFYLKDETKQKISKAMTGENNPMFGHIYSEETKNKMSKAKKGKHWIIDPETNKRKWI